MKTGSHSNQITSSMSLLQRPIPGFLQDQGNRGKFWEKLVSRVNQEKIGDFVIISTKI